LKNQVQTPANQLSSSLKDYVARIFPARKFLPQKTSFRRLREGREKPGLAAILPGPDPARVFRRSKISPGFAACSASQPLA
jgi:hypothetical protein